MYSVLQTVVIAVASFAWQSAAFAQVTPLAELSIEIVDNRTHIVFDTPDGNLVFLLDTGATTSIFFENSFVPETAFTGNEAQVSFPAIGHSVTGSRLGDVPLGEGEASFISKNGLLIVDEPQIKEALEADFNGIIGQELFRRYLVEIDPQQGKLRLYPPGTDLEEDFEIEHRLRMQGHTPYIMFKSRLPWERRATAKNMMLDSGYPGGLVFWSKKHFMKVTSLRERKQLEPKQMGVLTAANVSFGNLYFENLPIFISSSVPNQSEDRDGLIGASILAQYRHVIDFEGQRLLLSPVVDEKGDPVQMIDGAVYTPNNEDFIVKFFGPKIPVYPVLTLYSAKSRPLNPHKQGASDHN